MSVHIQLSLVPASDALNAYIEGALTAILSDTTLSEDVEMKDEEEDMAMEVDEKVEDTLIVDVEMKDYKDDLEKKNDRRLEFVFTHCAVNGNEEGRTVLKVCADTMRGMEILLAGGGVKLGVVIHEHGDASRLVKPKKASVMSVAFESEVQINVEFNAGTFNDS